MIISSFTGDVSYAQVFLTSILYFKGRWKMPFNVSETHVESFYDEKNNKIGEVDMMFQIGVFPYQRFEEYMFHAFELPYGHVSVYLKVNLTSLL